MRPVPFLSALIAAALLPAAIGETLTYTIEPDFSRHVVHVELRWETSGSRTRSALGVSRSWGRVRSVVALLQELRFGGGVPQQDGQTWYVSHSPGALLTARYTVDAGHRRFDDWDLTHHPIVTDTFFHAMGNAFLMVPRKLANSPEAFETILRWKLPAGREAICSWGGGRHVGARINADDLRHSVYLAGDFTTRAVARGERTVTVALVDAFRFEPEQFLARTKRIIDAECTFMLDDAFPDFLVTAIPVGPPVSNGASRLAGTGLYNSFALFMAPRSELNDAFEHLFAHELFHYWNGRILPAKQPERLAFWFVEGFTDYFALRALHDGGVWDDATYLKWINKHIREYARNPAMHATNEQIERGFWSQRDTVGEVAYQRGLLLGLRWHALAKENGQRTGLDAWMIGLVDRGRDGFEIGNAEIRGIGIRELGRWFGPEFDRYVVRAEQVTLPPDALGPGFVGRQDDTYAFALGFDREATLRDKQIRGLVAGSAAARAGLRNGDRLVGLQVQPDPGVKARATVLRDGRRKQISFYPRGEKLSVMQFRKR